MKLEDMIMAVENRKGKETNFLTNMWGYMEMAVKACDDSAVDLADAVEALYETKAGKVDWSDLYFAGNKSIHAAFCTGEAQLRGFLAGNFNNGEWSFDAERCSEDCLGVLRIYNMKPDGHSLFPYLHYERVEHTFHAGEVLHNMNGNDYRVLAALSPKDLLLMSMADSQIIVGRGVQLYERYPKGERPDSGSMVTGIEWDHGVYLGQDITRIDFDILKQEYGEPDRAENVSDLRDVIRRNFWMQKNVEQKEGLPDRVRNAARDCLEDTFGTSEPDVFDKMLDNGLYDGMYHAKEEQRQISGQSR
uniref:hypothetical protein n=1 Tax=Enterocloster clostridioformis TaxID=1531 RepID=UPI0025A58FC0|nr:hypothetical protein [Enterocloster clostridioformis]